MREVANTIVIIVVIPPTANW